MNSFGVSGNGIQSNTIDQDIFNIAEDDNEERKQRMVDRMRDKKVKESIR